MGKKLEVNHHMKPRDTKGCPWVNKGGKCYIVAQAVHRSDQSKRGTQVFALPQIWSPNSHHSQDVRNPSENRSETLQK